MTMNTLNQVSKVTDHQDVVCDALIDQIKSAQSQIIMHRDHLAHVETLSDTIVITVSVEAFTDPIPKIFGRTPLGLKKALGYINQYVTLSPIGSSSTHGSVFFRSDGMNTKGKVIKKVIQLIPRKDLSISDVALIEMMYAANIFIGIEMLVIQSEEADLSCKAAP
jgi:hypothetical protein